MAEIAQQDGAAIEVRGLVKSYADVHAVQGIDLLVQRGQIFALLGPSAGRDGLGLGGLLFAVHFLSWEPKA